MRTRKKAHGQSLVCTNGEGNGLPEVHGDGVYWFETMSDVWVPYESAGVGSFLPSHVGVGLDDSRDTVVSFPS